MNPDWFVLMQEWTRQGHGARGVTLAFLVGALALRDNNFQPTTDNARVILSEMIANPVEGYSIDIGWCATLGAPVLSAISSPRLLRRKLVFLGRVKKNCALFSERTFNAIGTYRTRKAY